MRKKFTGYERDTETNLDFAQARYNSFTLGRFSSPDPLMASAKPGNPQTWNRYAYVINNPLKYVDPTGMIMEGSSKILDNQCNFKCRVDTGTATRGDLYLLAWHRDNNTAFWQKNYAAPYEQWQQQQQTQRPANILIRVGVQRTYNGDPIVYPNGAETDEKYYGQGIINQITVVDEKGNPIEADSGVTLREDVKLIAATPKDAKDIVSKSEKNDLPFEPAQPGVIYDRIGPISTNPDTNSVLKELPKFSVTLQQTLTVKDAQGREVLRQKNIITVTNSAVNYKVGKAYVPSRYSLFGL